MKFSRLFYIALFIISSLGLNAQEKPTSKLEEPVLKRVDAQGKEIETEISESDEKMARILNAAKAGNLEAQYELGKYYANPDEKSWKPNLSKAAYWWTVAGDRGHAKSLSALALMHFNGEYFPRNMHKAGEHWLTSAELGDPEAQYYTGVCYANGMGLTKSAYNAFLWWGKAAKGGNEKAKVNLGLCYARGEGTKKDMKKAIEIWTKAAEEGNVVAQSKLAACYFTGDGVAKDEKKAAAIWAASAEGGNVESMRNLAFCYKEGVGGLPKNFERYKQWIHLAARGGDKESIELIKSHPALR